MNVHVRSVSVKSGKFFIAYFAGMDCLALPTSLGDARLRFYLVADELG
jgi:hypothetical protein